MKKTIVLMTIVLAILAAPVFAEVTTSGSADFAWMFGTDDNYAEEGEDKSNAKITLDGAISDYTSVSASFSADSDDDASLSSISLTQDVTGLLGMDAPVSFSYTVGFMATEASDLSGVAPANFDVIDAKVGQKVAVDGNTNSIDYETGDITEGDDYYAASDMLGFKLMIGLADMLDVTVGLYPGSMQGKDARGYYPELSNATEMFIGAGGTFGMVDANVFYAMSTYSLLAEDDGDAADDKGNFFGGSIAASPVDGVSVGFALEHQPAQDAYDIDGNDYEMEYYYGAYALNAGYTMDALSAGLSFKSSYTDDEAYEDVTFVQASSIGVSAKYAVSEALEVYAMYNTRLQVNDMEDDADITLADLNGYEVGAGYTMDGVTYGLSYSLGEDGFDGTDDAEFMNEDGDERVGAVTLSISASF